MLLVWLMSAINRMLKKKKASASCFMQWRCLCLCLLLFALQHYGNDPYWQTSLADPLVLGTYLFLHVPWHVPQYYSQHMAGGDRDTYHYTTEDKVVCVWQVPIVFIKIIKRLATISIHLLKAKMPDSNKYESTRAAAEESRGEKSGEEWWKVKGRKAAK